MSRAGASSPSAGREPCLSGSFVLSIMGLGPKSDTPLPGGGLLKGDPSEFQVDKASGRLSKQGPLNWDPNRGEGFA